MNSTGKKGIGLQKRDLRAIDVSELFHRIRRAYLQGRQHDLLMLSLVDWKHQLLHTWCCAVGCRRSSLSLVSGDWWGEGRGGDFDRGLESWERCTRLSYPCLLCMRETEVTKHNFVLLKRKHSCLSLRLFCYIHNYNNFFGCPSSFG